jgi:hypothetical protein
MVAGPPEEFTLANRGRREFLDHFRDLVVRLIEVVAVQVQQNCAGLHQYRGLNR